MYIFVFVVSVMSYGLCAFSFGLVVVYMAVYFCTYRNYLSDNDISSIKTANMTRKMEIEKY